MCHYPIGYQQNYLQKYSEIVQNPSGKDGPQELEGATPGANSGGIGGEFRELGARQFRWYNRIWRGEMAEWTKAPAC